MTPHSGQKVHILGIGGIGMSAIAELMHAQGYVVQGSDKSINQNILRLQNKGMKVSTQHTDPLIQEADIVVHSSAVKKDAPALLHALALGKTVLTRAEALRIISAPFRSIAIAGTHGKTTTTSLIAHLLKTLDPTVLAGGIMGNYQSNVHIGTSPWLVVEADESDGTFTHLRPNLGVVTNIEPEHLDFHQTFEHLCEQFCTFVTNMTGDNPLMMLCTDSPSVKDLLTDIRSDKRICTYGVLDHGAHFFGHTLTSTPEGTVFDVTISQTGTPIHLHKLFLPMHGVHNISNALAAIGIAHHLGLTGDVIREALASFKGIERRFTHRGTVKGITIIDDYAHHPTEIKATLSAARAVTTGKVIAVFQPHRYSRLKDLYQDFVHSFDNAEHVLITPIYEAGESPLPNISDHLFAADLAQQSSASVHTCQSLEDVCRFLQAHAQRGDMVVCMGAGDITQWAQKLPGMLHDPSFT